MPGNFESFGLQPGRRVGSRYVVEFLLGGGSEGEVYQIRERDTGIVRAAKFYYPHRDPKHHLSIRHARKLNTLRRCAIVLQYHHSEIVTIRRHKFVVLISDLCDGEPLDLWVAKHRGRRLPPYMALHVLYHLTRGLEAIHALGEYHADVHSQNILIKPVGIGFELKLIDFYDWGKPTAYKRRQDIVDTVRVFYECLGGKAHYKNLPPNVKYICCGMRRQLILQRFARISDLRQHLESFPWSHMP